MGISNHLETNSSDSFSETEKVTPGDMKDERVDVPSENDVLCGRGGSINSHNGNEQFRQLVEKRKRVYLTARFKREKRLIASSIVTEIRQMDPPGRFLARKGGKDNGYWYDIGDEKASQKTSQALRENAPSIRAEIETEINEQRREMKQKEDTERPVPAAAPSAYPPSAPNPYYPQQYWDWYYHYYGYGAPPPPPPPPPHAAAFPPPPPPPPGSHPGAPHAALPPPPFPMPWPPPSQANSGSDAQEEYKEDFKDDHAGPVSTLEEDHRLAMAMQHEENTIALEDRKRRHSATHTSRSGAFVSPFHPPRPADKRMSDNPQPRLDRRMSDSTRTAKVARAMPPPEEPKELSQEQKDHRLAVALQEQEDSAARTTLNAGADSARRTSRSNAYTFLHRAKLDAISLGYDNTSSSFAAWMGSPPEPPSSTPLKSKRSVQFKDDSEEFVIPGGRSMTYSPINLPTDNNVVAQNHMQTEQSGSILSQVASQLMGSLGSWDVNGCSNLDSSEGLRVRTQGRPKHGSQTSFKQRQQPQEDPMEMQGTEVQLEEVRDELSMPPPEPRVQIDWPSRVGSCHSWLPETLGAAAFVFPHNGQQNNAQQQHPPPNRRRNSISTVNSLEMDNSDTGHLSLGNDSVGGGSLCHVFNDQDDMIMHRAIREVPSWERSMRSKSPLSMGSLEDNQDSMIRVRHHEFKQMQQQAQQQYPQMAPIMDEGDQEMEWEGN